MKLAYFVSLLFTVPYNLWRVGQRHGRTRYPTLAPVCSRSSSSGDATRGLQVRSSLMGLMQMLKSSFSFRPLHCFHSCKARSSYTITIITFGKVKRVKGQLIPAPPPPFWRVTESVLWPFALNRGPQSVAPSFSLFASVFYKECPYFGSAHILGSSS